MYLEVMDEARQIHGRFPRGVLLVTDDASNEAIPTWEDKSARVTSSRTALVVKVLHEVDGSVTVRVARQQSGSEGVVMFDGAIDVPSGILQDSPTAIEIVLT
jgi:hypothetical protein